MATGIALGSESTDFSYDPGNVTNTWPFVESLIDYSTDESKPIERYPNSTAVFRFGNMVFVQIAFAVHADIASKTNIFSFPAGYEPEGGAVSCVLINPDTYRATTLYRYDENAKIYMRTEGVLPFGFWRGIMLYTINPMNYMR